LDLRRHLQQWLSPPWPQERAQLAVLPTGIEASKLLCDDEADSGSASTVSTIAFDKRAT